ncbi:MULTISPECIES: hypothetical protein [unclassified Bradyrhizobium]|uniref:hypothetical protein n=1 Tax=unclassified Bradyrhizobium TaxID=2631580 RepID=UPI003393111B
MPRPPEDFILPNLREPVTGMAKRLKNLETRKGQGRPKGASSKIVRDLKEGLIESAVQHGRDGRGKDGLVGFCIHLAVNHPRSHAGLLAKLLPLHVSNDSPSAALVGTINILGIPHDQTHDGRIMSELSPSFERESRPPMRVVESAKVEPGED